MNRVSKAWVNGVTEFYATMDPDPWSETVEFLDKILSGSPDDSMKMRQAIAIYEDTLLELIALYTRIKEIQGGDFKRKPASASDIFWTGSAPGQQQINFYPEPETPPEPQTRRTEKFFPPSDGGL